MQAKYPQLKNNFHLRKEKTGYLLYQDSQDPDSIICSFVSNQESCALGLMSGADSLDNIAKIIQNVSKSEPNETKIFCANVFQKYKKCIQLSNYPSKKPRSLPILEFAPSESFRLSQPSHFYDNRLSAPLRLCIMTTALCNCSCRYCCNKSVIGDPRTVPSDTYIRVLQEAKQSGCINISFTGGEPTLYPQLPLLIQTCTNLGLNSKVASRAQIDMDLWEVLLDNGLGCVQISLDSMDEEIVDSLSGSGVFKKTMAAISLLVNKKIHFAVHSIMTRPSIGRVEHLVDGLLNIGVKQIALRPYMPAVGQSNRDNLQVTQEQKNKFNRFVSSKSSEWGDTVFAFLYTHELSHRILPNKYGLPKVGCRSGSDDMLIAHNGNATYCDRVISIPGMTYGNVQNSSLLELWHSRELIQLRNPPQSTHKGSLCGDCQSYTQCLEKGKCYYYSYFNHSDLYTPDFLCSRIPTPEQMKGIV